MFPQQPGDPGHHQHQQPQQRLHEGEELHQHAQRNKVKIKYLKIIQLDVVDTVYR